MLRPLAEAHSLHAAYPGPKRLYVIDGARHLDWMEPDDGRFKSFAGDLARWLGTLS